MNRRGFVLFVLIVGFAAIGIAGYTWNRHNAQIDQDEARANTYALCTIQNENRKATRINSAVIYNLVAAVLKSGGPTDPDVLQAFQRQLAVLAKQLKALREIDCSTYVRPVPPDTGVR
jgi:hypothetical protein